jgi:hypothetical protein
MLESSLLMFGVCLRRLALSGEERAVSERERALAVDLVLDKRDFV